jgi:hypothetical protein
MLNRCPAGWDSWPQCSESMGRLSLLKTPILALVRNPDLSIEEANQRMAQLYGANIKGPLDRPNSSSLPNPWSAPKSPTSSIPAVNPNQVLPFGMPYVFSPIGTTPPAFSPFGQMPQQTIFNYTQPQMPLQINSQLSARPEALYAEQLASLQEMGFEVWPLT